MKFFRKQILQKLFSCCYVGPTTSTAMVADSYDPLLDPTKGTIRKFNPQEIDTIMTTSTVIGQGGFSTVYLSHIDNSSSSSSLAAFKVQHSSERLNRIFRQELEILRHVGHHPNIARLLGYCDGTDEGVLVLEYVPNGTLHDSLHRNYDNALGWHTRTAIAFQLAVALDYLHGLGIIHGDVKASNVLLDRNNHIKICDFGSARMGFSGTVVRSDRIVGSPGYVDPHYMRTGLVSRKCDVYSFGILLLELVSGMEAFCPEEGKLLSVVVREKLRGGVTGGRSVGKLLVDPKMKMKRECDFDEVAVMVEIAKLCTDMEEPCLRPSMSQVLRIMKEKIPSLSNVS